MAVNGEEVARIQANKELMAALTSANASASNIVKDATAWVNGEQITGTLVISNNGAQAVGDTKTFAQRTVGTATADDITKGKTAWVNGIQVTGTYDQDSYIKNFYNQATATENDIVAGKTAWIAGGLKTGKLNTSSAGTDFYGTAEASDIKIGKTAISGGTYITGNLVIQSLEDQTKDATATAADIALGKTAYVNGVKIIGTKSDSSSSDSSNGGYPKPIACGTDSQSVPTNKNIDFVEINIVPSSVTIAASSIDSSALTEIIVPVQKYIIFFGSSIYGATVYSSGRSYSSGTTSVKITLNTDGTWNQSNGLYDATATFSWTAYKY